MKYRDYQPDQMHLLPQSLREWLPEDHLCYFISDLVDQLDLSAIYDSYDGSHGGQPPYHPLLMMSKLLFYAYCVGVPPSRKIEKKTYEPPGSETRLASFGDVAFRIIAAGDHPDHDTISEFRHRHLPRYLYVMLGFICSGIAVMSSGGFG